MVVHDKKSLTKKTERGLDTYENKKMIVFYIGTYSIRVTPEVKYG